MNKNHEVSEKIRKIMSEKKGMKHDQVVAMALSMVKRRKS